MILQNVAVFSQRATWIRHKHTYLMFLLNLLSPSWFHPSAPAKSLQSCLTLCDPIDGSPPGSAVPGILQARTLEWVAMPFPNAWKWKVKVKLLSRVWVFATSRTAAYQAPPPMGFFRQEYWSGMPLPSPPTPLGWYKVPGWVPWGIQEDLSDYLFYIWSWEFPCYSLRTSQPLIPSPT